MDFFISNAYAQAEGIGSEGLVSLLPLVLIFVVFYFLLIRPQSKRQKEHRELVAALSVGDEVTTAGGLLGKVVEAKESFVRVEVADNVVLTVQKHTISAVMPKGTIKSV
jgi:preprotein translocase subunit YajC